MASTKCVFLFALCAVGLTIVVGQGSTGLLNNPCWSKACHSFAMCKVVNGTEAVCVCPKNCTSARSPVCGTNWKSYDNVCSLMAESCAMNDWNNLRYNGECGAGDCRNSIWQILNCPWYSRCQLAFGLPRCVCPPDDCPKTYEPVCATDGRTYRNMCHMRYGGCKKRKLLRVRNVGHCRPDPCTFHDCCCGATCRVNETNSASCSCDFTCNEQYNPVCGSDGQTYNNPCELRLAACKEQNMKLTQISNGPCFGPAQTTTALPVTKTRDPCLHQFCSYHATCVVEQGFARCICPICSLRPAPVCGSNGVTYNNECLLKRSSCVSMTTIAVAHNGTCGSTVQPTRGVTDPCLMGQCAHYATCMVFRGVPKCVCPDLCPQLMAPICGSDGVTYENDCAMRRASCKSEKTITMYSRGPCEVKPTFEPVKPTMDPCFGQTCSYHAKCIVDRGLPKCVCPSNCRNISAPLCGSNGITYENSCVMKRAICTQQLSISVVSEGRCVSPCDTVSCCCGAVCKVRNNTAFCECDFLCSSLYDPVCGSDGKTYNNECQLRHAACHQGDSSLKQMSRGQCPSPTPDPCAFGMCAHYSTCKVIQGLPRCVCPELCPTVFSPKCGTDGNTYQNECALKRRSCDYQVMIAVAKDGHCVPPTTQPPTPTGDPCARMICRHFSTCQVVQGVAQCVCSTTVCPSVRFAVCGSDGKTYENECALRRTSCLAGRIISIVRVGVCLRTLPPVTQAPTPTTVQPTIQTTATSLCAVGRCAHNAICEVYQGQPRCVCPSPCTGPKSPVCGSDGRTYDSECDLKRSSCTSQKTITVVKPGFCEPIGRCPTPRQCKRDCDLNICKMSGKLCCCQGCAIDCTTPIWSFDVRQYVCPADPLGCRNDADCIGGRICCDTGCSKRCVPPRA